MGSVQGILQGLWRVFAALLFHSPFGLDRCFLILNDLILCSTLFYVPPVSLLSCMAHKKHVFLTTSSPDPIAMNTSCKWICAAVHFWPCHQNRRLFPYPFILWAGVRSKSTVCFVFLGNKSGINSFWVSVTGNPFQSSLK